MVGADVKHWHIIIDTLSEMEEKGAIMKSKTVASSVLYIHSSPLIDLRNKPYITDVDILNCSSEEKIISNAIRDSNLKINFRSIIATVQNVSDAIMAGATMIHYAGKLS